METIRKINHRTKDGLRTTKPKALPHRMVLSSQKDDPWRFTWDCRLRRQSPSRSIVICTPPQSSSNKFAMKLACQTTRPQFHTFGKISEFWEIFREKQLWKQPFEWSQQVTPKHNLGLPYVTWRSRLDKLRGLRWLKSRPKDCFKEFYEVRR